MRKLQLLSIIIISCIILQTSPAQAKSLNIDEKLAVNYHPESLVLEPGGGENVDFSFMNICNVTLFVAVTTQIMKGSGASEASINPDFFEIAPGDIQKVLVYIQSHATYSDYGLSDCSIQIAYGVNLTLVDGEIDPSSIDGGENILITVRDDIDTLNQFIFVIIACIISVLIILIFFLRRKRLLKKKDIHNS